MEEDGSSSGISFTTGSLILSSGAPAQKPTPGLPFLPPRRLPRRSHERTPWRGGVEAEGGDGWPDALTTASPTLRRCCSIVASSASSAAAPGVGACVCSSADGCAAARSSPQLVAASRFTEASSLAAAAPLVASREAHEATRGLTGDTYFADAEPSAWWYTASLSAPRASLAALTVRRRWIAAAAAAKYVSPSASVAPPVATAAVSLGGEHAAARMRTVASGESEPGIALPSGEGESSVANGDRPCDCDRADEEGGPLLRSLRRELREARCPPACDHRSGSTMLARRDGVPATDEAAPIEHINELSELPPSSSSSSSSPPPSPGLAPRSRLWRAANSGDESISRAVGRPTAAKTSS